MDQWRPYWISHFKDYLWPPGGWIRIFFIFFCFDCDSTLQYLSNKLLNTSVACHWPKLALAHMPPGGHIGFYALTHLAPGGFFGILCFHYLGVIIHHSWKIQLSAFYFWVLNIALVVVVRETLQDVPNLNAIVIAYV